MMNPGFSQNYNYGFGRGQGNMPNKNFGNGYKRNFDNNNNAFDNANRDNTNADGTNKRPPESK